MPVILALIIGIIIAVIGTVLMYMFVIPDRCRDRLPAFLQFIHDIVNFKTMLLEDVIKILYVFLTLGCIITGILLLFGSTYWIGLIVLIIGPLVLRIIYEMIMLFVLQVQNVISINRKMK